MKILNPHRFSAALLAAALLLLLTACGRGASASPQGENSASEQASLNTQEKKAAVSEETAAANENNNDAAPDFTFEDQFGTELRLKDILKSGKPVVLNFWATWCPPCRAEMPHFEAAFGEYGEEIEFMMVDLTDGQRDTTESAKKFIEDAGYTFPVYFDTKSEGVMAYGISAIPTTFFIRPDGTLAAWAQGALSEETLAEGIRRLR